MPKEGVVSTRTTFPIDDHHPLSRHLVATQTQFKSTSTYHKSDIVDE